MNFFKALFGGEESPEEKQKTDEAKNFDMFKYDGVRAAKIGKFEYAIQCYREALKIREDLEVRDYLAQALIRNNQLDEARDELNRLAEAEPDNQAILLQLASVAYMMEDYEAMAAACEKAMTIDNTYARVHYLYAQAYIGQDNMIGGIAMLTKAIALDPDYADAMLLRGRTLLKLGDVEGAATDAKLLAEKYPDIEDVLLLKASVEAAQGNNEAAIATYDRAIEMNPFSAEAFKGRGAVRYEMGDKEGAQEDMQKALELNPDDIADISGDYSAEGVEHKVKQAYSNLNPLGL